MPSQHSTTEFSIMIKLAHFLNILRTASFKWTSLVVTNSLKLNGVNGKGDAKFHICKCAVDVHEEHNKVARGGGPKTFIRAIWRRATCGHINVGVVWAMFILFLPCAPSAPVGSVEYAKPCAPSAPVDSAEYAKQLEIAEAKISYAFSWQAYVIFSASIFAIGAVVLASCVLCVSIGCYGRQCAPSIKLFSVRPERKLVAKETTFSHLFGLFKGDFFLTNSNDAADTVMSDIVSPPLNFLPVSKALLTSYPYQNLVKFGEF
uniref:Uncharacterized protein n=1 Tax=Globodera rostochiensis TaxID=31243 RepID=A0A914GVT9_GLORO